MSDKLLLEQSVVKPLLSMKWEGVTLDDVKKLPYGEEIKEIEETAAGQTVANGDLVLALDGAEKLYEISLRNYPHRAVAEPPTETVIKGPREGFTEEIKTNVSLVRRRIKSPRLKVKKFTVGKYGNTTVMMVYIDDIVDKDVVLQISEKIKSINIDGIIGAEYVSRFVSEHAGSIFNQSGMTENPTSSAQNSGRAGCAFHRRHARRHNLSLRFAGKFSGRIRLLRPEQARHDAQNNQDYRRVLGGVTAGALRRVSGISLSTDAAEISHIPA